MLSTPGSPSMRWPFRRFYGNGLSEVTGYIPKRVISGHTHHLSQKRGSMDKVNEDMHPPGPVGDSTTPFPWSQVLTRGLASLQ